MLRRPQDRMRHDMSSAGPQQSQADQVEHGRKRSNKMNTAMNATRRTLIARSAAVSASRPAMRVAALSTIAPSRHTVRYHFPRLGPSTLKYPVLHPQSLVLAGCFTAQRHAFGCLELVSTHVVALDVWDSRRGSLLASFACARD